ncbi:hypothetical protein GQ43DRAFT_468822 [Delitschia confertaspora ATCC 74209]|uniref:Uncharacterized protein n=1 Tax=Delitschia confertaspora ATCC 74209 TaxID=1513339 RepID=A0A9P4JS25_9PLEO|nr:hypothetical protein GQ43DRAFT_468822 [Delitschia confertaspora ATCC 74209]
MRSTTTFLSLFLTICFTTADLIPALQARTPESLPQLEARSLNINSLGKRQFCPVGFAFCTSNNGDTICQSASEVCCQLTVGTDPYTCPLDHPYCCGADQTTGILMCGNEETCAGAGNGGNFFTAPAAAKPTEASGTAGPTKTANGNGGGSKITQTAEVKKGTAAMMRVQNGGVAVALVAAGVVGLL